MEITLLAVGKLRPGLRGVADDYARRLTRFTKLREIEVKEASRAPSVGEQRDREAESLEAKIPAGGILIALERGGIAWDSEELAREVARWRLAARPVALAIGGSHGLSDALLGQARTRWSLGPLTLPHELARVVVLEQLYRACTILAGVKYHKGR